MAAPIRPNATPPNTFPDIRRSFATRVGSSTPPIIPSMFLLVWISMKNLRLASRFKKNSMMVSITPKQMSIMFSMCAIPYKIPILPMRSISKRWKRVNLNLAFFSTLSDVLIQLDQWASLIEIKIELNCILAKKMILSSGLHALIRFLIKFNPKPPIPTSWA